MEIARGADLRGARLVECDLRGARLVGCEIDDLRIDAFAGDLGSVVVEGVEVTGYVAAELDRRHPERVAVREARTAADLRAAWDQVHDGWRQTLAEVVDLPPAVVDGRVDDEWSLAETLRHLVFAVDTWIGRILQDRSAPYSPWGLPTTDTGPGTDRELGLQRGSRPPWSEVVAVFADRCAQVTAALAAVTDEQLGDLRTVTPYTERGEVRTSVHRCLLVVLREHVDHRRYALRDLAVLTRG